MTTQLVRQLLESEFERTLTHLLTIAKGQLFAGGRWIDGNTVAVTWSLGGTFFYRSWHGVRYQTPLLIKERTRMIKKMTDAVFAKPSRWLVAGIAATIVLAIFMEGVARVVLGGPMKPAGSICQALGLDSSYLWLGEILHYGLGIIAFPIGYVAALAATGMRSGIVSGAIWGIILWVAAGTIMMSLAGQPLFFGYGKTMVASLVAHLAYGAVLGAVFSRR